MIGVILEKELTEYRRDGRVIGVASLIGLLVLGSLMTGWSTHTDQQRQAREAQRQDQATFLKQGEKPPHSAAHFGRVAYKPVPALAVFDPGAAPYLGQAIWLEAHRQDPAMFRPAEDSPELRRLADLSVAGVLRLLVPLLVCLVAYGAFAAERERGTLRHIVSMGARLDSLFAGKSGSGRTRRHRSFERSHLHFARCGADVSDEHVRTRHAHQGCRPRTWLCCLQRGVRSSRAVHLRSRAQRCVRADDSTLGVDRIRRRPASLRG